MNESQNKISKLKVKFIILEFADEANTIFELEL